MVYGQDSGSIVRSGFRVRILAQDSRLKSSPRTVFRIKMRVVIKGVYHILSINSCWYFYLERLRKHFLFWRKQCHITQGEGVGEMSPNVTRGRGGPKSVKKVSHTI
jgi:hypothetical protein